MATKPSSVFNQSDRNLVRLRKMCDAGSTKALHILLKWLNPNWKPSMSFKDYLKEKNIKMKALNSALKPHQRTVLKKDPQGDTYDIALLYILILWGNEDLADKDDEVWHKEGACLEFLITAVKNVRNNLTHCYEPIDAKEFLLKTEALRKLLKEMLNCAGNKYEHITQDEVDQTLHDVDILINKIRDDPLDPKDFDEYRKQLIFPEQRDFVKMEGTKALQKRYSNYSILTPLCHLAKVSFPVNEVFTDMVLKGGSKAKHNVELHYLLEKDNQCNIEDIILLEGDAGVGKTTLVKKILSDWVNERSSIKHLDTYDLVIHAECRDHFSSFKGILDSSMAEVSKSFQHNDLMFITLSMKCLVVIDGFDELNKISANLFMEILQLKKIYDITVIVTSRPEAITKYYQCIYSYQIKTRHIQLLGISPERREVFIRKYHSGMEKISQANQDITSLLKYLKRTEHRLEELWRLPYNLTILTILWSMRPDIINSITTAPELHWEMHQLYLSKLKERLLNNETTKHLCPSVIEKKVHQFIYTLCQVSLKALENDDVTLPKTAYQQLENTCNEAEIPVEEMAGAFLKRTTSNSGTRYSYPHKGLQDFLAALFIWIKITTPFMNSNIVKVIKSIDEAITQHNVSDQVNQNIKRLSKRELMKANSYIVQEGAQKFDTETVKKDVTNMLFTNKVPKDLSLDICQFINERIDRYFLAPSHSPSTGTPIKEARIGKIIKEEIGRSGLFSVAKFQNMFTILIGLFYQDNTGAVENNTRLEALELLQRTGVTNKKAWLQILNSVKCDEFVASYINKEAEIMEFQTKITDSTIFAYISLMKAIKPPLPNAPKININLDIKGDVSGVGELLKLCRINLVKLICIQISDSNFSDYTKLFEILPEHLIGPCTVKIDIVLREELSNIMELMLQIKRNNFLVRRLDLLTSRLVIDQDFESYNMMLKSMPILLPNASSINVSLKVIERTPSIIDELLHEISRNKLNLDLRLIHDFLNPGSISTQEDTLNEVFKSCMMTYYKGAMTKGMKFPYSIGRLCFSIGDAGSYSALSNCLNSQDLGELSVCMSHHLAAISHLMEPLPDTSGGGNAPRLFITDVKLKMDVDNAVILLKKLVPVAKRGFYEIVFPGASLTYELLEELLSKLTGLQVIRSANFPSSNKPSSPEHEQSLQQLALDAMKCERGIVWEEI